MQRLSMSSSLSYEEPVADLDEDLLAFAAKVFQAARAGSIAELESYIDAGVPVNLKNDQGDSLLMLAAYNQNAPAVELLLNHGANPCAANDHGQTPLGAVAYKGDMALAELLINAGADVNGGAGMGRTALMMAAMFNRREIVKLLLKNGADPMAQDGQGMSAVDAARVMGATDTPILIEEWIRHQSESA